LQTRASISVCSTSYVAMNTARRFTSSASSLRSACASSPAPYAFEASSA